MPLKRNKNQNIAAALSLALPWLCVTGCAHEKPEATSFGAGGVLMTTDEYTGELAVRMAARYAERRIGADPLLEEERPLGVDARASSLREVMERRRYLMEIAALKYNSLFKDDDTEELRAIALRAENDPSAYFQWFLIKVIELNPAWVDLHFSETFFESKMAELIVRYEIIHDVMFDASEKESCMLGVRQNLPALQLLFLDFEMATALNVGLDMELLKKDAFDAKFEQLFKDAAPKIRNEAPGMLRYNPVPSPNSA